MRMKRILTAMAAGVMIAAMTASPAFAHGHHRRTVPVDTSCPVCTVEGCEETGRHTHDGHDYCGYDHSSGYCDHSCERTADCGSHHGGHHGCHR